MANDKKDTTLSEKEAALAAELDRVTAERDAAQAALQKSGAPAPILGSYKGYRFEDGHRRVRDAKGNLCDTGMLLEAANDSAHPNHAVACAVLNRLIQIKYAYFTK
jgi:hypothetical protein